MKYGVKVVTLSNGRYPEYFGHDSLRRIGSVVYNTRLHRVAYLLPADSLRGRTRPEVSSRWLSPDPLANLSNEAFTTVDQRCQQMGETAVQLLQKMLPGSKEKNPPRSIVLKPKLIVRESSLHKTAD